MRLRYWLPFLALSLILHAGFAGAFGRRPVVAPPPETIRVALEPIAIRRAPPRPAHTPPPRATPAPARTAPPPAPRLRRAQAAPLAPRREAPVLAPAPLAPARPSAVRATPGAVRSPSAPLAPLVPAAPSAAPPASAPARTASPAPAAAAGESSSAWLAAVAARLARYKTYPNLARNRGQQGTVYVDVTVDRAGNVLAATLTTTSGFVVLDTAALDLVRRATPLPAPPASLDAGLERISVVVPVAFTLQ